VPYRRSGKLIVATDEAQVLELQKIRQKAHANGVTDVDFIPKEQAMAWEPALRCVAALHSPSTGIIDSHALMLAYQGDAEAHGAMLALQSPLEKCEVVKDGFVIQESIHTKVLVNSAGLRAPTVARLIGVDEKQIPKELYAKGNYYSLTGKNPFSRLVYPVPEPGGLGVHVTLDMAGQARFGPDVEWVDTIDYTVDPRRADAFYAEVREYWPLLPDDSLAPAYSGIRPKLSGPGEPAADFVIAGPPAHGVPDLVNLFGIESPGLTACLAIADEVAALLRRCRGGG
jgi:L-2-hydroxyglutarate oxidase LhgO